MAFIASYPSVTAKYECDSDSERRFIFTRMHTDVGTPPGLIGPFRLPYRMELGRADHCTASEVSWFDVRCMMVQVVSSMCGKADGKHIAVEDFRHHEIVPSPIDSSNGNLLALSRFSLSHFARRLTATVHLLPLSF